MFRLPAVQPGGAQTATLGGSVLVIPECSSNRKAALAFVEYALCTMQGTLSQYRDYGLLPAYERAWPSPDGNQPDPLFGNQRIGTVFTAGSTTIWPLNRTGDWNEAINCIQQDLSGWLASGMPNTPILAQTAQDLHTRLDFAHRVGEYRVCPKRRRSPKPQSCPWSFGMNNLGNVGESSVELAFPLPLNPPVRVQPASTRRPGELLKTIWRQRHFTTLLPRSSSSLPSSASTPFSFHST